MNKIVVYFNKCSPAPAGGYKIFYRVVGSTDPYILGGTFYNSPAVFYDENPAGTCYEGYLASVCSDDVMGNHIAFETCGSVVLDNSSCGTIIAADTEELTYVDLGLFDLHVDGASHVALQWDSGDRPNRFTLFKDGIEINSTGWKGYAPYPGPWGSFLSTAENGTIGFDPILGSEYKVRIEVGPAGSEPPYNLLDSFSLAIVCS